jgi:tartrate dehydrogenase/decarboxylase/D-malate dehydrogenase
MVNIALIPGDGVGPEITNIALIPGDGVGPEITTEATRILEAAGKVYGFPIETETFDWSCDRYLEAGEMMPPDALETLADFDAIFLGCIGDANKVPDHVSLEMLLGIRVGFDQYVNLRPIRLYPGVPTPIRTATPETVDFVVIRENTEDEPHGFALQTGIFTRKGCERVMRYAFDLAEERKAAGYPGRVTNCTKSNALNYSMVFWDRIYDEIAAGHPDIQRDMAMVDALTMWFVKNPDWFDVVVASNLFGDIVTDLGAMLQGGMGFAAGGNIDPERRNPSMFEPIHGSAPKYTGQRRVNPIASIEAIRMMLDHLGQTEAADAIGRAVAGTLTAGEITTRDIGGTNTTNEVGTEVAHRIMEEQS